MGYHSLPEIAVIHLVHRCLRPAVEFSDHSDLALIFTSKQPLIGTIFSGSRTQELPRKILFAVISQLCEKPPELASDEKLKIMLTYSVFGGCYAFNENRDHSDEAVIETLEEISGQLKLWRG
ncbi:hypothetical protein [Ruminococcus sp.]|uniref:hypothetical protein n=1 Tax=Ruminococcus sp. TaxID=41978 RepID=UPI0025DC306B|nr:hypothetical protein [Ruminococcus sp.]MBQ6250860.1 hypothetical protein [Ruminococcus sp.]